MSEELKPCPFCGGDVRTVYPVNPTLFDNHFLVICQQCGCIGPFSDEWKNGSLSPREFQEKAVIAWNTRAVLPDILEDEPSKEIVYCKDCQFRGRCTAIEEGMTRIMFLDCSLAPDNGFCAWGERKEANDGRI